MAITAVNHLPDAPFPLDKFPVNEESLPIWTNLFYLASQVFFSLLQLAATPLEAF